MDEIIRSTKWWIIVVTVSLMACGRDTPYQGPDLNLRFSMDTLRFDTVFTSIGSATRSLKIYNDDPQDILIPRINLANTSNHYRININGEATDVAENIFVPAEDSIYIFVEVTVDPDDPLSISPFIIEDVIHVWRGEEILPIYLEAFGQNANYLPSSDAGGEISLLTCDMGQLILDDPKPYVIYGVLAIDECEIVIPPGTKIYVHGGVVKDDDIVYNDGLIVVLANGKITSLGTVEEPVVFQGDRLEAEFEDVVGQWSGIRFLAGSQQNSLQNTIIKNAVIGARVDSTAELSLDACQIYNTASSGVIGYAGIINMTNCLVYNNGGYSLQMVNGGQYQIKYSTFSNYFNQLEAVIATNYICTDPLCVETIITSPLEFSITNCIIDGNSDKEIVIDDLFDGSEPSLFHMNLANITIKHDEATNDPLLATCFACQYHDLNDAIFLDRDNDDYSLDTMSVALGKGMPLDEVIDDILGKIRSTEFPDLGCYEAQF